MLEHLLSAFAHNKGWRKGDPGFDEVIQLYPLLEAAGLVESATMMRSSQSGQREVVYICQVQLTEEGRAQLARASVGGASD